MKRSKTIALTLHLIGFWFASGSSSQDINGTWLNIGWFEEGLYNNEAYSDTVFLDTIEYSMVIDSDTCKAYAFHEDRIYSLSHSYTLTNDSIYSQPLQVPLSWKRTNDTLFTSMMFVDDNSWERTTFIFLLTPALEFPDNWPLTNITYIPDELTPFGIWSFGISPENSVGIEKQAQDAITNAIQPFEGYFQINGRYCQLGFKLYSPSVLVNNRSKQLKFVSK